MINVIIANHKKMIQVGKMDLHLRYALSRNKLVVYQLVKGSRIGHIFWTRKPTNIIPFFSLRILYFSSK